MHLSDSELEAKALAFATKMHEGQTRKYTGRPYISHPMAVANTLREHGYSGDIVAAALLHDVVEDCDCTEEELRRHFPKKTCDLVMEVTDVPHSAGNRQTRKAMDFERLKHASPEAQTIKMADIEQNTLSIATYDPAFARIYLKEVRALLNALTKGDPAITARAHNAQERAEAVYAKYEEENGKGHEVRLAASRMPCQGRGRF